MNTKQTADGQTDSSELFTQAEFREHEGSFYIDYDESEATGFEGCHIQLRISPDVISMTRTGKQFSSLTFEAGKRHFCHYGTEFGGCMLGVSTVEMSQDISSEGGSFKVKYTIDVNGGLLTTNELSVKVRLT